MSRTPAEPGELLVAMVGPHTAVQQAILELQGEGDVDTRLTPIAASARTNWSFSSSPGYRTPGASSTSWRRCTTSDCWAPAATGPAATANAFWQLARRDDADGAVLHVACHGTLSVEDPLSSGLLLVDAKIDAAELAVARIGYDEVVLSVCSTGWRPQAAEGIALRRAAGETPLAASRATQRDLLASGEHEPYTWTGIVCYAVR